MLLFVTSCTNNDNKERTIFGINEIHKIPTNISVNGESFRMKRIASFLSETASYIVKQKYQKTTTRCVREQLYCLHELTLITPCTLFRTKYKILISISNMTQKCGAGKLHTIYRAMTTRLHMQPLHSKQYTGSVKTEEREKQEWKMKKKIEMKKKM